MVTDKHVEILNPVPLTPLSKIAKHLHPHNPVARKLNRFLKVFN